jgi:hypothetical protein
MSGNDLNTDNLMYIKHILQNDFCLFLITWSRNILKFFLLNLILAKPWAIQKPESWNAISYFLVNLCVHEFIEFIYFV